MDLVQRLDTPADGAEITAWQNACASLVIIEPGNAGAELIAAVDVAYARDDSLAYAAAVVVERASLRQVEHQSWSGPPPHPYESGRFSLREAGCAIAALAKLTTRPDALIVDGHGIAHPRGFGLACHLGVVFDLPTIGCAKQPLAGTIAALARERGARAAITIADRPHAPQGQRAQANAGTSLRRVGTALRTREGVKPVYVSPGHRFDVDSAAELILALSPSYRIPEPLRQAHHLSILLRAQQPG